MARNSLTSQGMWDMAARLTYAFGFGEKPPSAAGPGGPQMIMIRGGGGAGDLLGALGGGGAENKRIRIELFVAAANLLNTRQPDRLLGCHDVAVLRPADGRGTGAEDRCGDEDRILKRATRSHEDHQDHEDHKAWWSLCPL